MSLLSSGSMSKAALAERLGIRTVSGSLNRTIAALLEKELIEYTLPDKPKTRLQKYRLAPKGRDHG